MNHANAELIRHFYTAFQQLDAESMAACYTEDVHFRDPAFGELHGREAADMWRMLCQRAKDFSLTFDGITADDQRGTAPLGGDLHLYPDGANGGQRYPCRVRFPRRADCQAL